MTSKSCRPDTYVAHGYLDRSCYQALPRGVATSRSVEPLVQKLVIRRDDAVFDTRGLEVYDPATGRTTVFMGIPGVNRLPTIKRLGAGYQDHAAEYE